MTPSKRRKISKSVKKVPCDRRRTLTVSIVSRWVHAMCWWIWKCYVHCVCRIQTAKWKFNELSSSSVDTEWRKVSVGRWLKQHFSVTIIQQNVKFKFGWWSDHQRTVYLMLLWHPSCDKLMSLCVWQRCGRQCSCRVDWCSLVCWYCVKTACRWCRFRVKFVP